MRRRGLIPMIAGALLLLASLGLAGYNLWDDNRAAAVSGAVMEELSEAIQPVPHAADEQYIPDYILDPKMELPTVTVDREDYIGYVEIPVLGLSLPVLESWSYPNLKLGPCRFVGSPYEDNMVIAAHNYRQHFGRLKELAVGDEVRFTDMDGNVFRYSVVEQQQLSPRPAEAILEGVWDLSLFTCTTGGQYRTTIRCERMD